MKHLLKKLTDTSDGGKNLPWISRKLMAFINGYDHQKYWYRRSVVVNPKKWSFSFVKDVLSIVDKTC